MLHGDGDTGVPAEAVDEYVSVLSAPGALTAALNWYRAMSSDIRVDPVEVPTTFVWSDGDVAIGRTAAQACAEYVTGDYRFVELPGVFFCNATATTEIYTLSLHDALPI